MSMLISTTKKKGNWFKSELCLILPDNNAQAHFHDNRQGTERQVPVNGEILTAFANPKTQSDAVPNSSQLITQPHGGSFSALPPSEER